MHESVKVYHIETSIKIHFMEIYDDVRMAQCQKSLKKEKVYISVYP